MARKLSLLLVVLAVVAAACGGDDAADDTTTTTTAAPETTTTTAAPETTTTTAAPTTTVAPSDVATLRDLIGDASLEATSARFEGTFQFLSDGTAGLPADFTMTFSGAVDNASQSSQIMVDFGEIIGALGEEVPEDLEGLFAEPMEIITIGTTAYVKWGLFSFFTGPGVEWIEFTDQDAGSFVSEFSFGLDSTGSPLDQIEQLAGAGAEVEVVGAETIRGVETTHYRVIADVEALAEELPADEAEELRNAFGEGGLDELEFDIYIGGDGLLYRYAFDIDTTGMQDAEGLEGMRIQFDIYDYNADIVIEAPEGAVSGEELGGLFEGFLGGF